jgi:RNA polymerase sigma-70 factor, ECF subfamily
MDQQERHSLFEQLLARHQSELYGYIYAVVRNWQDSDDVYQSVCLVLWSKFGSFQPGTSFFAWARRTARNKISEFLRTRRSAVHVGEKRIDALSDTAAESFEEDAETYLTALRSRREKLPPADDELLQLRYGDNLSTVEIARRLQRLRPSVSRSLNRIRQWLFDCVESELAALDDSPEGLP